jgi:EAL domain-containing protein (putative c-di-GMP-specific phosphodiesterase class I)
MAESRLTMTTSCEGCRDGAGFDIPITMAFHPIVNVRERSVFAHEALVRGADGQGAGAILSQVSEANRYAFDQKCRVKAIELAADLKLASEGALLSINFLPNAVYEPRACIRLTLAAAMRTGFPIQNIIFEFTEVERLDSAHVLNILRSYRAMGFKTAIDDFGAGYAGLGLLSEFQPDLVKLDMDLIRGMDKSTVKQNIVRNTLNMMRDLGVTPICEGIETLGEMEVLRDLGVDLMQGYLFAKPGIATLPTPAWPGDEAVLRAAG